MIDEHFEKKTSDAGTRGYLFLLTDGFRIGTYTFRSETIAASYLYLMILFCKVFMKHTSKQQLVAFLIAREFHT